MVTSFEQLPGEFDLEFWAGDSVRFRTHLEDPDPGSPDPDNPDMIVRPLDGYTAAAQVRKNASSEEVIATFTVENTLGADGDIYLYLPPAQSDLLRALKGTKGRWDLQLTDPNGDVETILAGSCLAKLDVTRD